MEGMCAGRRVPVPAEAVTRGGDLVCIAKCDLGQRNIWSEDEECLMLLTSRS